MNYKDGKKIEELIEKIDIFLGDCFFESEENDLLQIIRQNLKSLLTN